MSATTLHTRSRRTSLRRNKTSRGTSQMSGFVTEIFSKRTFTTKTSEQREKDSDEETTLDDVDSKCENEKGFESEKDQDPRRKNTIKLPHSYHKNYHILPHFTLWYFVGFNGVQNPTKYHKNTYF